jgi:predicted metal-binding protein
MSGEKDFKEIIDDFINEYPICEYYYLRPEDLIFSDKVRYVCEHECTHYNKSWACPPAIASIDQCIEECAAYNQVFLFTSVAEVADCLDFTACLEARRDHEHLTLELRRRFAALFGRVLALSAGCMLCQTCAYPDAPCRHPEDRLSTIESHGILIMETARLLGVSYDCGSNIVTYFSLIFFNA